MNKKRVVELGIVFVLLLLLAVRAEHDNQQMDEQGRIERNAYGEGNRKLSFVLNAEDILEDYTYDLDLEDMCVTKEEADALFEQAKEEIEQTFFGEGSANHVTEKVYPKESYVGKKVGAEWKYDKYNVLSPKGQLQETHIDLQGTLVNAEVELTCGNYKEVYSFYFRAYPKALTKEERLLEDIESQIREQENREGEKYVTLPTKVDGISLDWKNNKEYLVYKILILELVIALMLPLVLKEKQKKEQEKRQQKLLLDYPDLVSKLTILVGAGMTIKQAWHRISAQYSDKREENQCTESLAFEEMLCTDREIQDGESERVAYQRFAERADCHVYYRFVRILLQSLQKGSRGMLELLQQETENAFEERKIVARKKGEEASTKMLLPMIMMLGIVMVVILMPALSGMRI